MIEHAPTDPSDLVELAAEALWADWGLGALMPGGIEWPQEIGGMRDFWRSLARVALEAIDRAASDTDPTEAIAVALWSVWKGYASSVPKRWRDASESARDDWRHYARTIQAAVGVRRPARICACAECRALDRAYPHQGRQLVLLTPSSGERPVSLPLTDPRTPTSGFAGGASPQPETSHV